MDFERTYSILRAAAIFPATIVRLQWAIAFALIGMTLEIYM